MPHKTKNERKTVAIRDAHRGYKSFKKQQHRNSYPSPAPSGRGGSQQAKALEPTRESWDRSGLTRAEPDCQTRGSQARQEIGRTSSAGNAAPKLVCPAASPRQPDPPIRRACDGRGLHAARAQMAPWHKDSESGSPNLTTSHFPSAKAPFSESVSRANGKCISPEAVDVNAHQCGSLLCN